MRAPLLRVPAALALLFTAGCGPAVEPADLVLLNGRIVTVDEGRPEAQALAVRRDTIVAIGSNREIRPPMRSTRLNSPKASALFFT